MISIVICARGENISNDLASNIAETIGVPYELVIIDNSSNRHSIFAAYNIGIKRAQGDILCFMHDDVVMHTQDWGVLVEKHLQPAHVGLIGVVGGHILPQSPAAWWTCASRSGAIIQGCYNNGIYSTSQNSWWDDDRQMESEVAAVDGVWMCMRRELTDTVIFDEDTYSGFHAYDLDICLQVLAQGYQVKVVKIDIEHKSLGRAGLSFVSNVEKCNQKWKHLLPIVRGCEISEKELSEREMMAAWYWNLYSEQLKTAQKLNDIQSTFSYKLLRRLRLTNK